MRISRLAAPVTVLGPGRRLGLWVQGCTLACTGCASVDTWDTQAGIEINPVELASRLADACREHDLDGITVSGGEPFQQADELAVVLEALDERQALSGRDVLVFTGYTADAARRRGPDLWNRVDALVCGPYRVGQPSADWLRSSGNQELVLRTDLARSRYDEEPSSTGIQVGRAGPALTMAGLPRPGDLDRFQELMERRGIRFEEVSWKS